MCYGQLLIFYGWIHGVLRDKLTDQRFTGFPHFSNIEIPYFFKTFSRLKFDFSRLGVLATKEKIARKFVIKKRSFQIQYFLIYAMEF